MTHVPFMTRFPRLVAEYGADVPSEIVAAVENFNKLRRSRPAADLSAAQDATLDAIGTKSFDKSFEAFRRELAAARVNDEAYQIIRDAAETRVRSMLRRRASEIVSAFNDSPRVVDARKRLAENAPAAPVVPAGEVLKLSTKDVTSYKLTEEAWASMQAIAHELHPLTDYGVASNALASRVADALAVSELPEFDSFEHVGNYLSAARGARPVSNASMSSEQYTAGLTPALLARAGVTEWRLATARDMREGISTLNEVRKQSFWLSDDELAEKHAEIARDELRARTGIVVL